MRRFIWVFLALVASVLFIYRIAGNKQESKDVHRLENRDIRRSNTQQVNNPDGNLALKIDERATSLSLILGGMPFNTAGNQLVSTIFDQKATKTHISAIEAMWKVLEGKRLKKMRTWRTNVLGNINKGSHTLVYPFSGGDFLHAYTLFPNCNRYILLGTEPVGKLPKLEELKGNELNAYLGNARNILRLFSQRGYISSADMKKHISKQGVLPVLNVLLARTDNHISKVEYIVINKEGIDIVSNEATVAKTKEGIVGVRIEFLNIASAKKQMLVYLKGDLAQQKNQKTIALLMRRFDRKIAVLKAGGYLLHQPGFDSLRKAVLEQADVFLQDDTGIPLKVFTKEADNWDIKLYGRYINVAPGFHKKYYQNDLRKQYRSDKNIKPLPFAFGYQKQGANILVATRKKQ